MDGLRFDGLTRALVTGSSRRTVISGLIAGALGVAVSRRPVAAGVPACDVVCDPGTHCCPGDTEDFCVGDDQICCGLGGTCPAATDVCCGDTNCCPTDGYVCDGAACCETCDRYDGQCGEIRAFCGNDPFTLICGCGAGELCCEGDCVAGNCCSDEDCVGGAGETCGDVVCVDNFCQASGCQTDEECCGVECCAADQHCCDSGCQDDPCGHACKHDDDCRHGCCCNDGDCAERCCPDDKDGEPVVSLPNTGAGSEGDASWISGAALLGGAAALLGAKLKRDGRETDRPQIAGS